MAKMSQAASMQQACSKHATSMQQASCRQAASSNSLLELSEFQIFLDLKLCSRFSKKKTSSQFLVFQFLFFSLVLSSQFFSFYFFLQFLSLCFFQTPNWNKFLVPEISFCLVLSSQFLKIQRNSMEKAYPGLFSWRYNTSK